MNATHLVNTTLQHHRDPRKISLWIWNKDANGALERVAARDTEDIAADIEYALTTRGASNHEWLNVRASNALRLFSLENRQCESRVTLRDGGNEGCMVTLSVCARWIGTGAVVETIDVLEFKVLDEDLAWPLMRFLREKIDV